MMQIGSYGSGMLAPATTGVVRCLSVALVLLFLGGGCASAPKEPLLTPEQKQLNLESFNYAWQTVNDTYWDPEFGGVDWQAVHDELRPQVEQTTRMSEDRAIIGDMISRLGVSHFAIVPARVYEIMDTDAGKGSLDGTAGIDLRVIDLHALVISVYEDSPAAAAGVRPGWEILRIGETDVAARLQEVGQELADDPRRGALLTGGVLSRLDGPIGDTINVAFLDGEDRVVELDLPRVEKKGRKTKAFNLPGTYVWIETERLAGDVGYIAFNAFLDPPYIMQEFNDAMGSFLDAKGVIVDLRGNGGGLGAMAMGMMGWLVQERQHPGTLYLRGHELKFLIEPRATNYAGPVVVLIDGLSGSASEFFAGILKDLGRARVIGARSAGAVLGARIERLPNGDGFLYAAVNYIAKSGVVLEGVGVIPNTEVIPTRAALLAGGDPVLEAALEWIHAQP